MTSPSEPRAMARAVPGALGLIPGDDAAHVRADRRAQRHGSALVAIGGDLRALALDHLPFATLDRAQRSALGAGEAIANQVVRIVGVFLDVVPQRRGEALCGPDRTGRPTDSAGRESRPRRSWPPSVPNVMPLPAEAGRGELMVGRPADVRQAVRRLDDLTRPAMASLEPREHLVTRARSRRS